MAERTLVLSFFADEAAADTAAAALKDSGAASGDAIGILVLDGPMYLNVAKVGARNTATGAGVGAALLLLGPAGLGFGVVGATIGGALHHKGLRLADEDKPRIISDLQGGKAAVGVLARVQDAAAIQDALTSLGGTTSAHDVVNETALAETVDG